MKEITSKASIIVPFYDIDPMNIVWHGNYVKYIEFARCDFFKKINYTYMDMYKDGVMYPIAKMELKFIKSAIFGQSLIVKCILKEVEPAIIFKYEITDEKTGDKICIANSMQMAVDVKSGETIFNAPKKLLDNLGRI